MGVTTDLAHLLGSGEKGHSESGEKGHFSAGKKGPTHPSSMLVFSVTFLDQPFGAVTVPASTARTSRFLPL